MIGINNVNTTERLIQEVRARPPLWDQRNINYHNRIVVNALWQDIADLLKINSKYNRTVPPNNSPNDLSNDPPNRSPIDPSNNSPTDLPTISSSNPLNDSLNDPPNNSPGIKHFDGRLAEWGKGVEGPPHR